MTSRLGTIAVDLTPVLPGGDNGGAKIFVLELLPHLADLAPQAQFILLTHFRSHEELAILDRVNVRRLLVIASEPRDSFLRRLRKVAIRGLDRAPARLRNSILHFSYRWKGRLKRAGSGSLLGDLRVDLLFCPFTAPTYFEPGIPTICTIYDLQYKTYPQFFAAEDVAHRERTMNEAYRLATTLTAISDYSRDSAIAHGKLDPARIRTIYLRMGQRGLHAESDKGVLGRLNLSPGEYLIYPANFWRHKNHEMLLTAFGIACREGMRANVKLVCTGAPGMRQDFLIRAACAMNLGDRICFPGYLPNAELATLMANCTGVVFPSLYEGFGLPVIEAMSLGIPVACSNTTSLPEVAGDAAILFDPRVPTEIARALISLTEDESLRDRLIQRGLRRATEFSDAKRMATEYLRSFQDGLDNQRGESLLVGAFADGWTGRRLRIRIAAASGTQNLAMEFSAPQWLPQPRLTIQASHAGKAFGAPLVLVRGTHAILSLPIEPHGGWYEVSITPSFVPADSGHGDDQRELSAMLERCSIARGDTEVIELFPDTRPS